MDAAFRCRLTAWSWCFSPPSALHMLGSELSSSFPFLRVCVCTKVEGYHGKKYPRPNILTTWGCPRCWFHQVPSMDKLSGEMRVEAMGWQQFVHSHKFLMWELCWVTTANLGTAVLLEAPVTLIKMCPLQGGCMALIIPLFSLKTKQTCKWTSSSSKKAVPGLGLTPQSCKCFHTCLTLLLWVILLILNGATQAIKNGFVWSGTYCGVCQKSVFWN